MTPYQSAKARGDTRGQHYAARDAFRATTKALMAGMGRTRRKRILKAIEAGQASRRREVVA